MYPLPALFASLVLLMAAAKKMPWMTSASSRHIHLKQSILEASISMVQTKADKLTRQMGWSIDVHALIDNIFAEATNSTLKTKQDWLDP